MKDFPNGTTRRQVDAFLDEIEELVQHDYTREADITRLQIGKIRQDHALHDEPGNQVTDWDRLRDDLTRLEYAPLQAVQDNPASEPPADRDASPDQSSDTSPDGPTGPTKTA